MRYRTGLDAGSVATAHLAFASAIPAAILAPDIERSNSCLQIEKEQSRWPDPELWIGLHAAMGRGRSQLAPHRVSVLDETTEKVDKA